MAKISIMVVDDHSIVREGLKALLHAEEDLIVVAEAQTGREAIQLAKQYLPDVVIMDLAMPILNGWEATRQILRNVPTAKVLVLSSYSDDEHVQHAVAAGAAAYLLKHTAAIELVKAIHEVNRGNAYFSPAISGRLRAQACGPESYRQGAETHSNQLTSREVEVLQLIAEGFANKQIATELGLSVKTVEKHRQQVMNKLNIHDIAGLVRHAAGDGVIETRAAGVPPS